MRDRAVFLALAALHEVSSTVGTAPARPTLWLRALLAFLVSAASDRDRARRCADIFWKCATGREVHATHLKSQRDYCRSRDTVSALNGRIESLGYEASVPFVHGLARYYKDVKPDPRPGGMPTWGPRVRGSDAGRIGPVARPDDRG